MSEEIKNKETAELSDAEAENAAGGGVRAPGRGAPAVMINIYCKAHCEKGGGQPLKSINAKDRNMVSSMKCPYCGGRVYTDGDV